MARVASLLALQPMALAKVFAFLGVQFLKLMEQEFLKENVRVYRLVAEALDVLQAYRHVTIGYLLPTLT